MKVSVYIVTYEGEKRTETLLRELPEDEKRKISSQLTDRFMKRAGFLPVPG